MRVLESVLWPGESGLYKVVQVNLHEQAMMRFATRPGLSLGYHSDILRELLESAGVAYEVEQRGKRIIPVVRGAEYAAVGMGLAVLKLEEKKVSLFERSLDYGLAINGRHVLRLKELVPDWTFDVS